VVAWIEKHLKVPVNLEKSGRGPVDKSALLGFRLYSDGRIGVSPKAIRKLKDKVRERWAVARCHAMQKALCNATLNRYGFVIPWDFAQARP
jgi:hypothetical protein